MTTRTDIRPFGELVELAGKDQLGFDLDSPNRHQQALIVLGMAWELAHSCEYLRPDQQLSHYIARHVGSKPPTLEIGLVHPDDRVRSLTDQTYMPSGNHRFVIRMLLRHGGDLLIWRAPTGSLEGGTIRLASPQLLEHEFSQRRHGLYRNIIGGFRTAFDEAATQAAHTAERLRLSDPWRSKQAAERAERLRLFTQRSFEMIPGVPA